MNLSQVHELQGRCIMKTLLCQSDVQDLFASGDDILCRDFTCFELPDHIKPAFEHYNSEDTMPALETFDSILIFTDGTSAPEAKRLPPDRADELGKPDAWAFLVIGEHVHEGQHSFQPLGWTAQVVRYDDKGTH